MLGNNQCRKGSTRSDECSYDLASEDPAKIRHIQIRGGSQYLMSEAVFDTVTGNRFAAGKQSEF